jgi:crossover junction endodeoxyribonuclease RuvC
MIVLGLDPGLGTTGWGIIVAEGNRLAHIANGRIATKTGDPLPARLAHLGEQLNHLLRASKRCSSIQTVSRR